MKSAGKRGQVVIQDHLFLADQIDRGLDAVGLHDSVLRAHHGSPAYSVDGGFVNAEHVNAEHVIASASIGPARSIVLESRVVAPAAHAPRYADDEQRR